MHVLAVCMFCELINAGRVEHITKCSIKCNFSSPTCFGHSCDHNQVASDKNTVKMQISVHKYMINPLIGTFDLKIKCNIIHF